VVLKGAPTIVALPDNRAWINAAGNPGMATGGTGDVLTGMIASLIAQTGDPLEGTLAATWLHSHAADLAIEERGTHSLVATDIIRFLPQAYRSMYV
jgi:NAD(P)H-hydrate epimerase